MKNAGASVRAGLLNHSRATGESFNSLLEQYATGRFLWRLGRSPYRERFILKGAQLFRLWSENIHRPTRDLDLLGYPPETVIAEKLEAAVTLGIANSRMKDFFDLHWLSRDRETCLAAMGTNPLQPAMDWEALKKLTREP